MAEMSEIEREALIAETTRRFHPSGAKRRARQRALANPDLVAASTALLFYVQMACDPAIPEFLPYTGFPQINAMWYARHVMRKARALGLYPPMHVLESEAQRAA